MTGDVIPKEESPLSPSRVKIEDISEAPTGWSPSGLNAGKKASNMAQYKNVSDGTKIEDIQVDRSIGIKKPKYSGEEGPCMAELSGFNIKRREFDPEYDHDAEKSLAEMEFKETDSETDREVKLRVLRIYLLRLDERKKRKDFILQRNLLYPNPLEKEVSSEEDREVYRRLRVFMRFQTQEQHEALVKAVLEEGKIRRRIQELQECRAAGCRTVGEVRMYSERKREREMDSPDEWDVTGLAGTELLSEGEQQLCCENRLLPSMYLKMQEVLVQEIFKGSVVSKSDAHFLFKLDPVKVDSVYDLVAKKLGQQDEIPNI